ncbi:GntR family transcriptional regulator [Thalassospira sp.]|uniref:GntR family transcriptional regulator n=1 Tax=Thalassospira sp. TaxID=1912094 RepID=UPI003AA9CBEF
MTQLVETTRIVDRVFASLRDAILSGEMPPHTPLSVPELSRQLNVSRSPVREAVLQLVASGLAVEHARKGCFVTKIELSDLIEIHDMRSALEALAVSLVHEVPSTLVKKLNEQIKHQETALAHQDWRAFTVADRFFHECFHESCGNGRLKSTLANLRLHMEIALLEVAQSPDLMENSIKEHKQIVASLVENTPEVAAEVMRNHICSTRNRIWDRLQHESLAEETQQ